MSEEKKWPKEIQVTEIYAGLGEPWVGDVWGLAEEAEHRYLAFPDLYDALEGLMRRLDDHFGGPLRSRDWKEQEIARAALAKARGETS